MRRRIVFVRHASSPKPPGVPDFERPLDDSGRDDARRMARHLDEEGLLPRRVLSSSAHRASETLDAMVEAVGDGDERFDIDRIRDLYDTDVDGTCEHIWGLPDACAGALLVGHNPTWSDAVSWLTGVRTKMPKGAAAVLSAEGESWSEAVQQGGCDLQAFIRPYEID